MEKSDECLIAAFKGTPAAMPKFCALVPLNGSLIICLLRTGKILPPKAALKKARDSESFIFRGIDIFRRTDIFRRVDIFRILDIFRKVSFFVDKIVLLSKRLNQCIVLNQCTVIEPFIVENYQLIYRKLSILRKIENRNLSFFDW